MKYRIIIMIAVVLSLSSCEEWLNVQPRSQVEDTELFRTESGFKEALAGVYSSMVSTDTYTKEITYGFIGVLGQEWDYYYSAQYDDAAAYNYEASITTNFIRGIWAGNYSCIANVNNILAHVDDNVGIFSRDNHDVIKGEALALRAFLHFDLLRCFGVGYSVNPDMPSIPYSTSLSYRVFPQLSVKDVGDNIIRDLNDAAQLLKGSDPLVTKREITESVDNGYLINRQLHMNYYAVKALEARVYMWIENYSKALEAAEEVIGSDAFDWSKLSNLQAGYDKCLADEHLFALNNLTMSSDIADNYFNENSQYSFAVSRDRLLDYFDNATQDYRYTFLFKNGSGTHANNRYVTKYDSPSSNTDTYYMYKMPLIRLPEMYLIASEVYYRNGNTDASRKMLNVVRTNRNLPAINDLSDDYYLFLIHEYRREFIGEGQLFFLYKRLNRPTILYSDVDAIAEKAYTFPLPITETESAQRKDNR